MGAERNTHLQLPRHLTEEGARATKRALSLSQRIVRDCLGAVAKAPKRGRRLGAGNASHT